MPNHFATQILCRKLGRDKEDIDLKPLADANLCDIVRPMPDEVKGEVPGPNPPWHEWAIQHWGTKWGAYRTATKSVPGDNFSMVWVSFESAWNAPHRDVMGEILAYLDSEYRLVAEMIIYFEPYDESYRIEVPRR